MLQLKRTKNGNTFHIVKTNPDRNRLRLGFDRSFIVKYHNWYRYTNISSKKKIGSGAGMYRVPPEYDTLTVAQNDKKGEL